MDFSQFLRRETNRNFPIHTKQPPYWLFYMNSGDIVFTALCYTIQVVYWRFCIEEATMHVCVYKQNNRRTA